MHEDPFASQPVYWHTDANYSPKLLDSCYHPQLLCYILTNETIKIPLHGLQMEYICVYMYTHDAKTMKV